MQEFELLVKYNADGSVSVNGPINDRLLCYGMLEMAKDAVRDYNKERESKIIKPAKLEINGS